MINIQKGRLIVLKVVGGSYIVECACGNIFKCFKSRFEKVYTGKGCVKCRTRGENNGRYSHGGTTINKPEYNSWRAMIQRCYKTSYIRYDIYGGRGITVCDRWRGENGFLNFLQDMGKKPTKKHSIDRVDGEGNYEPGNCVWATQLEQMSHTVRRKV